MVMDDYGNIGSDESDDLFAKVHEDDLMGTKRSDANAELLEGKYDEIPKIVEKKEKAGRRKTKTGLKSINRIVIFYDDGTFSDHSQESVI